MLLLTMESVEGGTKGELQVKEGGEEMEEEGEDDEEEEKTGNVSDETCAEGRKGKDGL